jgi:hypothetical protein
MTSLFYIYFPIAFLSSCKNLITRRMRSIEKPIHAATLRSGDDVRKFCLGLGILDEARRMSSISLALLICEEAGKVSVTDSVCDSGEAFLTG